MSARVGIAGLGTIGLAVSAADLDRARSRLRDLGAPDAVAVCRVEELEPHCDVVVECAPADLLPAIVEPMVRAGKEAVVLSAGALLRRPELLELAREHGGHISVPTGALIGLDAVGAAAEGSIVSVRMVTRKPGRSLAGAPHLAATGIDPETVEEPVLVFSGTAREAVAGFPANLNIAAALALAGAGPDRTTVEVWLDPAVERNTHTIEVDADTSRFTMTIANVPSENPATGRITALSVIRLLRKRGAVLRVGT
jgi:aspartate dehydrogenase